MEERMTWAEWKAAVEAQGVTDDMTVRIVDSQGPKPKVEIQDDKSFDIW